MPRLMLMLFLFLLSLLTVFRAPTNWLWYVSILVTEFCWVFFCLVLVLLFWRFNGKAYVLTISLLGVASLVLFSIPIADAMRVSKELQRRFTRTASVTGDSLAPFRFWQMITGNGVDPVAFQTMTYDVDNALTLDFYPCCESGKKPCVVVVHGGSWAGGDSRQLPELNSLLANKGYHVASINYRLAPQFTYPAPVEDVATTLDFLRTNAQKLSIDTNRFILLGRSAGGQIVLSAAYTLHDPSIKAVISYYGPADMVWGWAYPTSPLVLDSRKVMANYLGGNYPQMPQQYVNSSATETATSAAPATLLIYGENDPLVSHLHGVRLDQKLDSLHVPHVDLYLSWATHAFDWTLNGPGGQLSTWSVLQFLNMVTTEAKTTAIAR